VAHEGTAQLKVALPSRRHIAELRRGNRVLEQNSIDVEGVKVAGAVAIDGLTNAGDNALQLGLVVLRDHRPRYSSLRLVGHEYETT